MTDRDRTGGGAMTGATGHLTPPDSDEAFVPGELREIGDSGHHADVTAAQGRKAPAQQGEVGEPGDPVDGPIGAAPRDAGYGSEHGLSPDDPAYRVERHPSASEADEETPRRKAARTDTDTHGDREEHF
ncbi:MAG: hypothetical protein ACRDGD_03055 [Candidatus Limnocylindria bacterium]